MRKRNNKLSKANIIQQRKRKKQHFLLGTRLPFFLTFSLSFTVPESRNPTVVLVQRVLNCRGTLAVSIVYLVCKGCLKYVHTFSFFFPPHSFFYITRSLSCRTLERSREVRGVTWEWQQMRRNEITRCLDIMSTCCAFSAKLLWQASQCMILGPCLSFCHPVLFFSFLSFSLFFFRRLPFGIGWLDTFTVSSPGLLGKGSTSSVVWLIPFNRPLFLSDTSIRLKTALENDR